MKTCPLDSFRIVKDMDIVISQKRAVRTNFLSAFMAVKEALVFVCTWIVPELSVSTDSYNYSHDVLQCVCVETAGHVEIIN